MAELAIWSTQHLGKECGNDVRKRAGGIWVLKINIFIDGKARRTWVCGREFVDNFKFVERIEVYSPLFPDGLLVSNTKLIKIDRDASKATLELILRINL
jgi:hypothetical protein